MKIAIIGAGYVGLTSSAVFAKLGHRVRLVEKDSTKVAMLKRSKMPFFEPQLADLVKMGIRKKRLLVTSNFGEAIPNAEVVFLCVGTPMKKTGEADLSQVFDAAGKLAKFITKNTVVVIKSTVPVGTSEKIKTLINTDIASCPEFLREGSAVKDTLHPDRIVIGVCEPRSRDMLLKLHSKLPGARVITDVRTAELIKYASNAFLATKISFINEIANLCDAVGANVDDVAEAMGLDPRIGKAFLKPGIGYGGSCFPKDTKALHSIAFSHDYDFKLLKAVIEVNRLQRKKFITKVKRTLGTLRGKEIGVLGLAFKNNTDDVRQSAALEIISFLLLAEAKVKAYDPKAMANAKSVLPKLRICKEARYVFDGANVVLILTEWQEFRELPWLSLKKKMKHPIVIDGRNLLSPKKMHALGFRYISVGRK